MLSHTKSSSAGTQTITYTVNDMHCPSCPKVIKMTLEELPGVTSVQADLDTKKVTIAYDPSLVSVEKFEAIIKEDGYTPVVDPLV